MEDVSQQPQEEITRGSSSVAHDEQFGDTLGNRKEKILRLCHLNVNGIPELKDDVKNDSLRQAINEHEIQILGLSETNRCWHLLEEENRWKPRIKGWWESAQSTIAYNMNDGELSTPFQPGGTMILSLNDAAHKVAEIGRDDTGLGRWCWTKYRGKHEVTLKVICAYQPCVPHDPGDNTTHCQQKQYFDAIGDSRTPRAAFLHDLGEIIQQSIEAGDQVILMMDCNEDVRGEGFSTWLQDHSLRDGVLERHGGMNAPATYNQGSQPIDGLFCSISIEVQHSGYLPFGSFPSDHRALWMDITYENAFGYKIPKCLQPKACKLQCKDPRIVKKWTDAYEAYIRKHKLHLRQYALEQSLTVPLNSTLAAEFEEILHIRTAAIKHADKQCRKRKMGNVPFTPALKKHMKAIELWDAVVKKKSGVKYSMSKL